MISIPGISQTSLTSLTAISPLRPQGVSSSSGALLPSGMSSIVQLSAAGRALSAGSVLRSSLQSLQADASAPTAGSVIASAQTFVAAFNQAQASIGNAVPAPGSESGSALTRLLGQTLDSVATNQTGSESLRAIGISAPTTRALSIDLPILRAAASADPAAVQAQLEQLNQPLLEQVARFETLASRSTGLANGESQSDGIQTTVLRNESAPTASAPMLAANRTSAEAGTNTNTSASAGTAQTDLANTPAQASQINTEAQRVINNNAFNPFYSAVIANYHLRDGATPRPRPLTEAPIPAPVQAVQRVRAISA